MRRGVTLVELLVAAAVIGLLMLLAVIGVAGARRAAAGAACSTNVRSCIQAFALYANDFGGVHPHFARPRIEDAFENGGISLSYYSQSAHWPMAAGRYLGPGPIEKVWLCPGGPTFRAAFRGRYEEYTSQYPPSYVHPSSYWMSHTVVSDPKAWSPEGRPDDPAFLRAVRVDEVAYPASKGVLVEPRVYHIVRSGSFDKSIQIWEPEGAGRSYTVGFSDGHVRAVPHRELTPGWLGDERPGYFRAPVMATPGGVLGRDVR